VTAVIERVGDDVTTADVFGGWGGSSQGMVSAMGEGAEIVFAANHSELAGECYTRNHPWVDFWQADLVDSVNPEVVNRKGKKVPGRYVDPALLPYADAVWFSPSCTHHSTANAKKAYERGLQTAMFEDPDWDDQEFVNSERSRVTMSCCIRYAEARRPKVFVVENVLEVTQWGPDKDGSTFKWWMGEIRKLGYQVKCLFLNSMFFAPCPQSRDRIYIVAWQEGHPVPDLDYRPPAYCISDACNGRMVDAVQVWKPATKAWRGMEVWGKYLSQYRYTCPRCLAPVHPASFMALSAIDLTNLGETLEERIARGKSPADSTMERIRRCIKKFMYAPPVLLPEGFGMGAKIEVAHPQANAGTVEFRGTTGGAGTVAIDNGGSPARYAANRSKSLAEQLPALTRKNSAALVTFIKNNGDLDEAGYRGHHGGSPLGTVTANPAVTLAILPMRSGRPRANGIHEQLATVVSGGAGGTGGTGALVALIPNRTNNVGKHASEGAAPIMTSATQGVIVKAAGNCHESPGQTRARHGAGSLSALTQTNEFGFAAIPVFRGDADVNPEERHVIEQLGTLTSGGIHQALLTGGFFKQNGGPTDTIAHDLFDALGTVTGRDTTGLVLLPREMWIDQWHSDPVDMTQQLAVVTTHMRHTLASLPSFEGEVTDEMLMQVRFRMLEPLPELQRAMAFNEDYDLSGFTKSQTTAGLGAAVTPPVSEWIWGRVMDTFRWRRAA
jgi:DNA (cytosine-5)-methyltransferase 1